MSTELTTDDRQKLYNAVGRQFPGLQPISRKMLQAWMPGMTEKNAGYVILRRNQDKADEMCRTMKRGTHARQTKILKQIKDD